MVILIRALTLDRNINRLSGKGKKSGKVELRISWVCTLLLVSGMTYAQSKSELVQRRENALKEISLTNELLQKTERDRKTSLNELILLNRKIKLRNNVIQNINLEVQFVEKQIDENNELIGLLEEDLEKLKKEYADMIYAAYKKRENYNKLIFVFAARDLNQAYKRMKYLQQYSKYRREQAVVIERMSDLIADKLIKLEEYREEKKNLLAQNEGEKRKLAVERQGKNSAVVQLQKEERKLNRQLREKERIANELDKAIQAIIAEEARKARNFDRLTPEERLIADSFISNKGRLPWPTERGVVTGNFGIQEHPVLKGVKIENFGIDIAAPENALARAVFDGEVKKVVGIPGANQAVIIQHGNYFSVYQNLVEVRVNVGDRVKTKQPLGRIFTDRSDDNKTVLNFMIWEEKNKMDPMPWLSRN